MNDDAHLNRRESNLSGLLTGVAAVITAIAAVVGALAAAGVFEDDDEDLATVPEPTTSTSTTSSTTSSTSTSTTSSSTTSSTTSSTSTTSSVPATDWRAVLRGSETFRVLLFGSEECDDEGEFGDLVTGQTYELTWVADGGGFVTVGPSRTQTDCGRHAPGVVEPVLNLVDSDLRLNLWGRNDFVVDETNGNVLTYTTNEVVGRVIAPD